MSGCAPQACVVGLGGLGERHCPHPLARPVESHHTPRDSPSGAHHPAASTVVSRPWGEGGAVPGRWLCGDAGRRAAPNVYLARAVRLSRVSYQPPKRHPCA